MTSRSSIELSRLRDIGWEQWDPIGLLAEGDTWNHKPFAEEYDSYLLHVASLLWNGKSKNEAITYLDWVGSEHMGLGPLTEAAHNASIKTVELIAEYLQLLSDQ